MCAGVGGGAGSVVVKNKYITRIGYRAPESCTSLGNSEKDKTGILNHEILCSSQEYIKSRNYFSWV